MTRILPSDRLVLLTSFLFVVCGRTAYAGDENLAASAEEIYEHAAFLARDELGGRDSGEPGLEVAAEYIAGQYREYGLEPAGDNDTYFQSFLVPHGARFATDTGARVEVAGDWEFVWEAGNEAEAFGFGDPADGDSRDDAPLVYVGYGISTTDEDRHAGLEYDDYAGVDVKDKVVLILRFTPRWERADNPFGVDGPHSALVGKLRNAREHGAAGVVLVTPPGGANSPYGLAHRASPRQPTIPAIVARRAVVERLLRVGGKELTGLVEATDKDLKPRSFELEGVKVRFSTIRRYVRLRNVAGRLPGADTRVTGETILIGAHYDHIGRFGGQVSQKTLGQVHNGADDNASGVAGLLELARLIAAAPRPRRSFLFVSFSGEEIGLLGSRHWVKAKRHFVAEETLRPSPGPPPPSGHDHGHGDPPDSSSSERALDSDLGEAAAVWEAGMLLRATGKFHGALVEMIGPRGARGWIEAARVRQVSGPDPVPNIVTMINLDMIGRANGDGMVNVIGGQSSAGFPDLLEGLGREVKVPVRVQKAGRAIGGSDHMNFQRHGIPILFFNTGIRSTYNTPGDDVETLNVEGEARIVDLIWKAASRIAQGEERPRFNPEYLVASRSDHGKPRLGVVLDSHFPGRGVRVDEVLPDSVASKAGLLVGDVIRSLAGEPVSNYEELLSALELHGKGTVSLTVERRDKPVKIEAEFPKARGFRVRFGSVPDYAFAEKGVRFEDIRAGTPAAKAGVRPGDILVRWGQKGIEDVQQWTVLLGAHKPGDEVAIQVRRDDKILDLMVVLEGR